MPYGQRQGDDRPDPHAFNNGGIFSKVVQQNLVNLGLDGNRPKFDFVEKPPSQMTMRSGATVNMQRPL